jgi:pilus assembly protein CpaF
MEGPVITMQELYVFDRTGLDENRRVRGTFKATGIRPKFTEKFEAHGIQFDKDLFMTDPWKGGRS